MAIEYFLVVDGIAGDFSDKTLTGAFEVDDFTFLATNPTQPGPLGPGNTDFSPLSLHLESEAITEFLEASTTGEFLKNASLIGRNTSTDEIVYSLNLTKVLVTKVAETHEEVPSKPDKGGFSISLDYAKIGLEQTVFGPDGKEETTEVFGWDLVKNAKSDEGTTLTSSGVGAAPTGVATTYYLLIDEMNGDAKTKDHVGWFELEDFKFEVGNDGSVSGGGGGTSGGKAAFKDLSLGLSAETGLAGLLARVADGKHLDGIRIQGVQGIENPTVVYDLTLGDVLVSNVKEGKADGYTVDFTYGAIWLDTFGQDAKGGTVNTGSFDWDLTKAGDAGAPPTLAVGADKGAADADDFFLIINGVAGDYSDKTLTGAFRVEDFSFGADNPSTVGGSGGTTGKVSFEPLTLSLSGETTAALMAAAASGKFFQNASLVGVKHIDAATQIITYNLNLADVLVQKVDVAVQDVSKGLTPGFELTLDYSRIGLSTKGIAENGTVLAADTFGWDIGKQTTAGPGTSLTSSGVVGTVGSTEPDKYYLLIDDLNGGSTDKTHVGWFDLEGFQIKLGNDGINSGGGGAVSTKTTFSDLTVTLKSEAALGALFTTLATGKQLEGLKLQGVEITGDTSFVVYDLMLQDIRVTRIEETWTDGVNGYEVSFDYNAIRLDTKGQDIKTGKPVNTGSFAWDLVGNDNTPPAAPTIAVGPDKGAPAADEYFLVVEGVAGDFSDEGISGAFRVDKTEGFKLFAESSEALSKVAFSPLALNLQSDALTGFLTAAANGTHLAKASLIGRKLIDGNAFVTYSLNLEDVLVKKVEDTNGLGFDLALDYGRIGFDTKFLGKDGKPQTSEAIGFDVQMNKTIGSGTTAKSTTTNGPSESSQHYLLIDDLDGGVMQKDHVGWFNLAGFTFETGNTGTSQVPGGDGGPTFGKLSLSLKGEADLALLLSQFVPGKIIEGVQIHSMGPDGTTAVYDLLLADVAINRVADKGFVLVKNQLGTEEPQEYGYEIDISYGKIWLDTKGQDGTGKLVNTGSFEWDVLKHDSDAGNKPMLAPADNNGPPTDIALSNVSIAENSALDTLIGNLSGIDPENNSLTYSLQSNPGNLFNIQGSTLRVNGALDFEAAAFHNIVIRATDTSGEFYDEGFQIQIVDLPGAIINGGSKGDVIDASYSTPPTPEADLIKGFGGDDQIFAQGGNDTLYGQNGNDTLNGGAGADLMYGGNGNDTYYVDNAGDGTSEVNFDGIDVVYSSITRTLGTDIENLILIGTDDINGNGNVLDNELTGNSGSNILKGREGSDRLDGGTGADQMYGGLGDDTYYVDHDDDHVGEGVADSGNDTINSSVSLILGARIENLTLTGTGALTGKGNTLDNVIVGNAGANTLRGENGHDKLDGRDGVDMLYGGIGNDDFVFSKIAHTGPTLATRDQIRDFAAGDQIDFSGIRQETGITLSFIEDAAFTGIAGQVRQLASGGNTIVAGDINGDKTTDFSVVLVGSFNLGVGDFIL